jgi:hypothetical protein
MAGEPQVTILFRRHADYDALAPAGTLGYARPGLPFDIERQPVLVLAGEATELATRRRRADA